MEEHSQKNTDQDIGFSKAKAMQTCTSQRVETTNLGKKLTQKAGFTMRLSLTSSTRQTV